MSGRVKGFLRSPTFLVALAAVVVHAGSLAGSFLGWDDEWLVLNNPRLIEGGFGDLVEIVTPGEGRHVYGEEYLPVRDLSWRVDRLFFGLNPVGYHLGNLLLFGAAAAALLGVLRALGAGPRAALIGALVFAVHPVATESVACVAHRKDVLMAAFVLTAWLAWLKDRRGLATVMFVGAVLSKLPAISFPALAVLGDLTLRRRFDARRVGYLAGLVVVAVAAVVVGSLTAPAIGGARWHGGTPWTNALSVGVAFLEGVRLLLVPVGLHVGRVNEAMTRTSPDLASLAGLAVLVGLAVLGIVALVRARREGAIGWRVVALASLGLLATQAPYLQVRPFWILFAERYMVLALVPLALVAGTVLARLPGRTGPVAAAAVLLMLAAGTIRRERDWRDTDTLFTAAIEAEPEGYIALEKVAGLRYAAGRFPEALDLATRAGEACRAYRGVGQAQLEEILVKSYWTRFNALMEQGRFDDAEAALDEYGEERPEEWRVPFFRGLVHHRRATMDHARWQAALRDGRRREAERELAGRNDGLRAAEPLYLEALRRAEDEGSAAAIVHHNLGLVYRLLDGRATERAVEQLERAVTRDPAMTLAWDELAKTYGQAGRFEEAERAWAGASRSDPSNPGWLILRAELLENLGRHGEARELRRRAHRLR